VPFPLRLTGIAVDTVNGAEKRIAILSGLPAWSWRRAASRRVQATA
jgi:hypothetical protein